MTNLVASLLISTNAHWTVLKTEPSDRNCLVIGCKADHSEKRTEERIVYRVTEAQIVFEGVTNRTVVKADVILEEKGQTRVLYSGWDYTKPAPAMYWTATNWAFPAYR